MQQFRDRVDELIDMVARVESGGRYDAWNPNDNGAGVSFGLIQFNQRKGALPELLRRMHETDRNLFWNALSKAQLDPSLGSSLLDAGILRTLNLNEEPFRSALLELARVPKFQQVQRDMARSSYFEPARMLAEKYGITSERGVAMCFDCAVQFGLGGLRELLNEATVKHKAVIGSMPNISSRESEKLLLASLARVADARYMPPDGHKSIPRRYRILNDLKLADEPLNFTLHSDHNLVEIMRNALICYGGGIKALQLALTRIGLDPGPPDGILGPRTLAAVHRFKEQAGLPVTAAIDSTLVEAIDRALAERMKQC